MPCVQYFSKWQAHHIINFIHGEISIQKKFVFYKQLSALYPILLPHFKVGMINKTLDYLDSF